jgi:hypothetical protein
VSSSITLFVPRVRCADETTGRWREKFGNDEMYLGAVYVGISADKSFDVRVVRTRSVGDDYDDGESVNWNQALFTFDLGDPALHPFPKAALASLVLAEHDWGDGRNDYLETVAEEFRKKLTDNAIDAIAKAALAAAGVSGGGGGGGGGGGPVVRDHRGGSGGAVVRDHRARALDVSISGGQLDAVFTSGPTSVPGVAPAAPAPSDGLVVSALKDWAKDEIKGILKDLLAKAKSWAGDDIFPPVLRTLEIPSASHTWNGSADTPEEIAEFTAHDGKYQVATLWQLRSTFVWSGPLLHVDR